MSEVTSGSWTGQVTEAASVGHKSPCVHAVPKCRVHRPFQSRAACNRGSGGMRRADGRHATAAPPACATIVAIMPTSIDLTD